MGVDATGWGTTNHAGVISKLFEPRGAEKKRERSVLVAAGFGEIVR